MLKVPLFYDKRRNGDIIVKADIRNGKLLVTKEVVDILSLNDGLYYITKGTNDDIFLFKKEYFEMFRQELTRPEYQEKALFRKIIRHFIMSARVISYKSKEMEIDLSELINELKWQRDGEVTMVYNDNMIYKPISIKFIKKREGDNQQWQKSM